MPLENNKTQIALAGENAQAEQAGQSDPELTCQLLNEALATEILSAHRYRHHQLIAKSLRKYDLADRCREMGFEETDHLMMLGDRILELGGRADFDPRVLALRVNIDYGDAPRSASEIIEQDLIAKVAAIELYEKIIPWLGDTDDRTLQLIQGILADELNHFRILAIELVRMDHQESSL